MSKRAKKDPTAWRNTPEFDEKYAHEKSMAQVKANATGFDYGLEVNDAFHEIRTFMLPRRENRTGHELRCEVVSCENLATMQIGHGCK
jgi:hypothetical protein